MDSSSQQSHSAMFDVGPLFLQQFAFSNEGGLLSLQLPTEVEFRNFISNIDTLSTEALASVDDLVIGKVSSDLWYPSNADCIALARGLPKMVRLEGLCLDNPGFDHPDIIAALGSRPSLTEFRTMLARPQTRYTQTIFPAGLWPSGQLEKVTFLPSGFYNPDYVYTQAYTDAVVKYLEASSATLKQLSFRPECSKNLIPRLIDMLPTMELSVLKVWAGHLFHGQYWRTCNAQSSVETLELWVEDGHDFMENIELLQFLGRYFPSLKHLAIRAQDIYPPTYEKLHNLGAHFLGHTRLREITLALEELSCDRTSADIEGRMALEWGAVLPTLRNVAFQGRAKGLNVYLREHANSLWNVLDFPEVRLSEDTDFSGGCPCVRHGEGYPCRETVYYRTE